MIARPDPKLQTQDSISIVVSLDAAHSMIALPVEVPGADISGDEGVTGLDDAVGGACVYEEWGYAERAWYLEKRQGFIGVLRALFLPTEGVVEVGIHQSIWAERTQKPPVEAFRLQISKSVKLGI
jgi:hypothetical protein